MPTSKDKDLINSLTQLDDKNLADELANEAFETGSSFYDIMSVI